MAVGPVEAYAVSQAARYIHLIDRETGQVFGRIQPAAGEAFVDVAALHDAIWAIGAYTGRVFKMLPDGRIMLAVPRCSPCRSIATDGSFIWVAGNVKLFKLDPKDGLILEESDWAEGTPIYFDGTTIRGDSAPAAATGDFIWRIGAGDDRGRLLQTTR
jgi:hypothetical protein